MDLYLAFDISTSNVGMTMFNGDGDILFCKHLKLETSKTVTSERRMFVKSDLFKDYVMNIKKTIDEGALGTIKGIFIEEPLIASNNQFTASLLQKFNGMCSYFLYSTFNVDIEFITVHDSRKLFCPEFVTFKTEKGKVKSVLSFPKTLDKKQYILEKISKLNSEIKWIYDKKGKMKKESYDMSDSICVGYSKLIEKGIINSDKISIN